MKLAIAANHLLQPTSQVVTKMAASMVMMLEEDDAQIYVRADYAGKVASQIEKAAIDLATKLGLAFSFMVPGGVGRQSTYVRDYNLVEKSDRVMAFFPSHSIMSGGTGHVVHAALQKEVPVEAWEVLSTGMLAFVGSDDGYEVDEEGREWLQQQWDTVRVIENEALIYKGTLTGLVYSTGTVPMWGTSSGASTSPLWTTTTAHIERR